MENTNTRNDIYSFIQEYLSKIENPTIFELGCHLGEDTPNIIHLCQGNIDYYAFEPVPDNISHISESLVVPDKVNFNLEKYAISDITGKCSLYISGGTHNNGLKNTMASSIRKPKNVLTVFPFIEFNEQIEVDSITIDDFCCDRNISKIDFIWCDIQGCEYDMIVGSKNMLPNIGLMLLEYSNIELYEGEKGLDDILNLLGEDWELVVKTKEDILVKNKKWH